MVNPGSIDNGFSTELAAFAQELIRIEGLSGREEAVARAIAAKMEALGYDEVRIDRYGNVLGRMGNGTKKLLFDSHTDTVAVYDADQWQVPPFSGEVKDGFLWGRGSVDMKSGLAASVFAPVLAKERGMLDGKTVYVTCTIFEEDCDGVGLDLLLADSRIQPDYAVVCEPSNNRIAIGHKGKAQIILKTKGVSAHGSAPEKGVNAIYEMAEIIRRVDQTNRNLPVINGRKGTLVLSRISSTAVSLNAVPSECEIYLDRRTVPGETQDTLQAEMDALTAGKDATWEVDTIRRTSWTGQPLTYYPLHTAWELGREHPLMQAFIRAYQQVIGITPEKLDFWDFSTNAVALVSRGIPVIGFGPGDPKLAHMRDERCAVSQIEEACLLYAQLIGLT
ncbi:MAG: YgeY family selenium metabolism-linked hydrolase [Anaerolineae bacterium]|nr:YgeY family selenium metabolism-linked hydrolase [Anaerolineae bacterium]